jgi:hypothetical protein
MKTFPLPRPRRALALVALALGAAAIPVALVPAQPAAACCPPILREILVLDTAPTPSAGCDRASTVYRRWDWEGGAQRLDEPLELGFA